MANILVTAGPTHEYLDDVRYFANGSSGRMGYAIAEAAVALGHRVVLVSGPTALPPPAVAEFCPVTSALQMQEGVEQALPGVELVVAVAAVADYRPAARQPGKPKKGPSRTVELIANPDILGSLGARKAAGELDVVLVGFALEAGDPDEILARGRDKLGQKNLDLIVVNHVAAVGADHNEATLVFRDGRTVPLESLPKRELAERILAEAFDLLTRENAP